jgi:hypothetical protein
MIRHAVPRAAGRVLLGCAALIALTAAPGLLAAQGKGGGKAAGAKATQAQQGKPTAPPQQVDCAIFEIEASNGKPGVDAALRPLAKKLKKPPFSSWKTFKLLKQHAKTVARMKALNLPLATGSKMSLLYRDVVVVEGKKPRIRLDFAVDDKSGKRKVDGKINLDSGDYYLIGGDELQGGGTYIVAVSCKAP